MAAPDLTLTASLRPAALDARRGVVRLHPEVLTALALRPGDPVRLAGRRVTAGVVAPAEPSASTALLYADDLLLGNLGVRDGGQVTVSPLPVVPARRVTLTGPVAVVAAVSPEMLRLALLGKVVTAGDDVSLLPQDVLPDAAVRGLVEAARRSLATSVGYAWTSTLLTVVGAEPETGALVTMDTVVGWEHGAATRGSGPVRQDASGRLIDRPAAGPGTPSPAGWPAPAGSAGPTLAGDPLSAGAAAGSRAGQDGAESAAGGLVGPEDAPDVDELPGLRAQAEELTELLDLGFHHREVLSRLGTTVALGVLLSGPAGSGKSALVRAVAARVRARVCPVWAPELAALSNDAAARRLRAAAEAVRADGPAVLLVSDVEALAPADEPGPLATVFRQVVAETVRAGAAVVCTTGRPEAVDPALRAPDLLSLRISVPLPDHALRREQLTVLTRQVPLAPDVRLDEVAGRTPGFVAADLAALVREAGVRAALRQKSAETPTVAMADFSAALEVVRPTSMAASTLELTSVTLADVGGLHEVKETLTESVLWPLTYPDTFARLGVTPPRGVLLYGPPGCGKTYLVTALAGAGRANVLSVKGAELLSKWVGESERAVRELFRRAREAAPTLVFLDEVDALAPVRGQATDGGTADRVVAALLTELDGVEALRNVVVVGATNRPELVDPALLRPGRLERLVYVPPPDGPARGEILRAAARDVPLAADVDLPALGEDLAGFSAADCAALIREAALAAMRESLTATTVTAAHVATARTRVRPSLTPTHPRPPSPPSPPPSG
ncbi:MULTISPECIES: AAA family ATPase [Micromonospora]|uniref:AAA family ATPase n=1 Tax=Micromonospora solifontis TaxID=2487138 RepID=A0ABX9WHM5_9ACTN|nr:MULTISPECIES: AAA family ATPase [Micromonospora]NES16740.1 AAA family ATPase [Micromonospora sp. PPF5-17B]NES37692.1 AAA family ATPase [Micromonospora solifontis]NES58430.1 AAA family ATPase [Micromonospora sp. PPF5-6]RNL98040.1 AAA family ATPase [Micromonospora solifontis]